tara:strand:+ start:312 stop:590 length:279 start_codon:yes stop_codon:yes gene_type:complete
MFCIKPTLPLKTPELSLMQENTKDQITRPVVIYGTLTPISSAKKAPVIILSTPIKIAVPIVIHKGPNFVLLNLNLISVLAILNQTCFFLRPL